MVVLGFSFFGGARPQRPARLPSKLPGTNMADAKGMLSSAVPHNGRLFALTLQLIRVVDIKHFLNFDGEDCATWHWSNTVATPDLTRVARVASFRSEEKAGQFPGEGSGEGPISRLASTPWSLHALAAARVSSRFLEQQMHWNCLKRMAM